MDSDCTFNDVTFCFLVTRDLSKEHIWREWLEGLNRLQFKCAIVVHCSHKGSIQSEWLKQHLIPDECTRKTEWGWVLNAMMSLYAHAIHAHPAAWYTLHSETCVPVVSPERFVEIFKRHKQHTFVSHCPAWWDPLKVHRANLHLLPPRLHLAHSQWCIFCHEDLHQMINLPKTDEHVNAVLQTVTQGHASEESYAAIMLLMINNLKNVVNRPTTLVDWKRTPNGNNPHTFVEWTDADASIVRFIRHESPNEFMFMRKIAPTFPDHVLRNPCAFF